MKRYLPPILFVLLVFFTFAGITDALGSGTQPTSVGQGGARVTLFGMSLFEKLYLCTQSGLVRSQFK